MRIGGRNGQPSPDSPSGLIRRCENVPPPNSRDMSGLQKCSPFLILFFTYVIVISSKYLNARNIVKIEPSFMAVLVRYNTKIFKLSLFRPIFIYGRFFFV